MHWPLYNILGALQLVQPAEPGALHVAQVESHSRN